MAEQQEKKVAEEVTVSEEEKREARRKRRVKNQVLAYLFTIIFIAAVVCGILAGVKQIVALQNERNAEKESSQAAVESMMASEEELVEPESTEEVIPEEDPEELAAARLEEIINAAIESMPIEDKVAGLFLVTPESITGVTTAIQAGDGTKDALSKYAVGGIVYAEKNIRSTEQFSEMLSNTTLYSKYPLFLAVAEEGGDNSPVAKAGVYEAISDATTLGESGNSDDAYQAGVAVAMGLSSVGINLNLAPVADLGVEEGYLGARTYGTTVGNVTEYALANVQGQNASGMNTAVKYFPGIGSATVNSTTGIATLDKTLEELRTNELTVFQALIDNGVNMITVSAVSIPELTGNTEPAVFSEAVVTDLLRNEMGFTGIILSDNLSSSAVSEYYGSDEAAILALRAGCDMIVCPENFETAYKAVLAAIEDGTISEERVNNALRRVYRVKYAE